MWQDDNGQWQMMSGSGAAWGMMLVFLLVVIAGVAVLVLVIRDPTRNSARGGPRGERDQEGTEPRT
jgi:hypothetical protein